MSKGGSKKKRTARMSTGGKKPRGPARMSTTRGPPVWKPEWVQRKKLAELVQEQELAELAKHGYAVVCPNQFL